MVCPRTLGIHGDIRPVQPGLAVLNLYPRIDKRRTSHTQGFHFGTRKHHAGLPRIFDEIVVASLLIACNCLLRVRGRLTPLGFGRLWLFPFLWHKTPPSASDYGRSIVLQVIKRFNISAIAHDRQVEVAASGIAGRSNPTQNSVAPNLLAHVNIR